MLLPKLKALLLLNLLYLGCLVKCLAGLETPTSETSKIDETEKQKKEDQFPEPLTATNFETEISKHLHVVEFFSPYCSHCKHMAPKWKEAWEQFHEEGEGLNITLSQVNCVESGDLCAKEKVAQYPSIRLYGPAGFIKNYPDDYQRNTQNFISFAREEALNADNFDTSSLKSQSEYLTGKKLLDILAGNSEKPYLVSFWPSKDLRNTDNFAEFDCCDNCAGFQRTWKILSNKLLTSGISSAHFNCESNQKICKELGFGALAELTNHRISRHPEVALVLPGKKNGGFIVYSGRSTSLRSYEDFAKRTYSNAEVPDISSLQLSEKINQPFDIGTASKTPEGKIYIVFNYDPQSVVPEDYDILEYMVEPLSQIPNAYLYKSKGDLMELAKKNYHKMFKAINYNESETHKFPNDDYFVMSTLTKYPTFFMFKEGSLIPNVFHGYSTTEMRNIDCIMDWVRQDSLPLINELTLTNYKRLINFQNEFYEKMAIQIVDTSTESKKESSLEYVKNFIVSIFDYESIRNEQLYETVMKERTNKQEMVDIMKQKNAPSADIVKKMREEIYHSYDHKVLFTYLDIHENSYLLRRYGLNVHNRAYNVGDVLIVDKNGGKFYYEQDPFGNYLTSYSPYFLKETLATLNFPQRYQGRIVPKTLINSPFGKSLRVLDSVHQFGFMGYLVILGFILFLSKIPKYYGKYKIKQKYRAKRDTSGLLGKNKLKD